MFGWRKNELAPAAVLDGVAHSPQTTTTGTLAAIESLAVPLVQEVVLFLVDFQCERCQQKVAKIMSKMDDIQYLVINVLEKKVTLVCTYSTAAKQIAKSSQNSWTRLFRYSCTS
ncbi:uncharacterized protein [Primulina eburnea]|uniref:uncharacterized protein n=1 Tax=Primulina eburnea TaxID=1245227 RepID=UPI003C6C3A7C